MGVSTVLFSVKATVSSPTGFRNEQGWRRCGNQINTQSFRLSRPWPPAEFQVQHCVNWLLDLLLRMPRLSCLRSAVGVRSLHNSVCSLWLLHINMQFTMPSTRLLHDRLVKWSRACRDIPSSAIFQSLFQRHHKVSKI